MATIQLSGKLTPLFGKAQGLKWPSFDVKELSIDSKGNVRLDGGWLSLPQQQTLDFYGFKIEIAQIGFGKTDDGAKWIGFSGALKLVEGLQAGASVEGLRLTWKKGEKPKISLNGAGVELKIPGVLELAGSVSFREMVVDGEEIRRFDGDIHLKLDTPKIEIDGAMVIGSVKGPQGRYNFFAIFCEIELPTGIPLASTGLAIYGFAGLLALQMEPDKKKDEAWFSIDHDKSFYHRNELGITDLKNKWKPQKGSFALGAGLTLGTLSDNGYTFNGKFLLALILPGPIVMLQGAASFLKKRADGKSEGQFRALAVFDGRAGSVLIGLDASYKTGKAGQLIEIGGSMEAFYAFHDPTAWHLYLGRDEPRELRIRALFGRFVEANAYFMLDAHALALGAWFGYKNAWKFGPLGIRLEAWAEGNARLSFKPTQFHGDLSFGCLLELQVFGFGLGLAIDANIAADLAKPFHLRGELSVGVKIPFRKKKLAAKVILEWGPRLEAPPIPTPLVQVGIEHQKSATAAWPLPRGRFLTPIWDDGESFLPLHGATWAVPPGRQEVPRVPVDAKIAITFARSTHDYARVGIPASPVLPEFETIGDPLAKKGVLEAKYRLASLKLERFDGAGWQLAAQSPPHGATPVLFGTWMPVPRLPEPERAGPPQLGKTKLLLGGLTPFDGHCGSAWQEWVSDALPGYPCAAPAPPAAEICFGFGELRPGRAIDSPFTFPGEPRITLSWGFGSATVTTRELAIAGAPARQVHVLCFPARASWQGVEVRFEPPGSRSRIVLAPGLGAPLGLAPRDARRDGSAGGGAVCIDFRSRPSGTLLSPFTSPDGARFTWRDAGGAPLPALRVERWQDGPRGLDAGAGLMVDLPCPASWVELLVASRPSCRVVAFDAAGREVAAHPGETGEGPRTIVLEGRDIRQVAFFGACQERLLLQLCYRCPAVPGPRVRGFDPAHQPVGPFFPIGGEIPIDAPASVLTITSDGPLCFEKICVLPDPEAGQAVSQQVGLQLLQEQLARWREDEALFEPDTFYRLTVATEIKLAAASSGFAGLPDQLAPAETAYFHTARAPGLEILRPPAGVAAENFDSGLDDLERYVLETDPPTVPPPGEKPRLYRPFYRAYDIGVEFNENYVERMYRQDRRDLGLYLFDNSNQPARDARGRLLALDSRWDRRATLDLSEKEQRWLAAIDAATCLPEKPDPRTFSRDATLASSEARVLAPDRLLEARLVPLLLREGFEDGPAGGPPPGFLKADEGPGGPSTWFLGEEGEPASRFAVQGSAIGSAAEPDRPGSLLLLADSGKLAADHPDQPGKWTDLRASVSVRAAAGSAGLVFRYGGAAGYYRFALNERSRRLIKVGAAGFTLLAEDRVARQPDRDYRLTVEAIGASLRAHVDGEPVFAVEDAELASGRVGLYVCQSPGARFAELRIEDFRPGAPVAYRFQLVTSLYANFYHHLHSFEEVTWRAQLAVVAAELVAAVVVPTFDPPLADETRAYEELAALAFGPAARQNPPRVEITRVSRPAGSTFFHFGSPEPLDWRRVEMAISRPARRLPAATPGGDLRLAEAAFGGAGEGEESITLLVRQGLAPTRQRVELRELPGPLAELRGDPFLLFEDFADAAALARFEIADLAAAGGPADWRIEGGELVQLSAIAGGAEPELPGTQALAGPADASDYRLAAELRSDAGSSLGLVFRWRDADNHYRLSADRQLGFRRLIKREAGQVTILWEDTQGYAPGRPFRLEVEAIGPRLTGYFDGERLFGVSDAAHPAGRIGVYCWNDGTVRCRALELRQPSLEARALLADRFANGELEPWELFSEVPGVPLEESAAWEIAGRSLRLRSLLAAGGDPAYPGAYAAAGDAAWTDVVAQASLRSAGGAIGMTIRGRDGDNYYRFSMSAAPAYRQLIQVVEGQAAVLWRDEVAYQPNRDYRLTLAARGSSLRGYLDGVPLFAVEDAAIGSGRVALYAWNNPEAYFSEVHVWPGENAYDGWLLDESFRVPVPGRWSFLDAAGNAAPDLWTYEPGGLRPAGAVAGLRFAVAEPEVEELRLAVRLRLDPGGVAGLVFGWQDAANFWALLLGANQGGRRLLAMEAGVLRLLWQDPVATAAGPEHALTLDAWNGRLALHAGGIEVFDLELAPPAGQAGLVVLEPGALFRELLLGVPEWTSWHAFGEEPWLAAGTRLRLHAEAPVSGLPAPAPEAGLERRQVPPAGERGRRRLPARGAVLRLVARDGAPGHRRGFLPSSAYQPLVLRLLRKADGTGFFFLRKGGSEEEEPLRLELKHHRDRPEAGRKTSQAGDSGPETAFLDFG